MPGKRVRLNDGEPQRPSDLTILQEAVHAIRDEVRLLRKRVKYLRRRKAQLENRIDLLLDTVNSYEVDVEKMERNIHDDDPE